MSVHEAAHGSPGLICVYQSQPAGRFYLQDRGVQYTAHDYRHQLTARKLRDSVTSRANAYSNVMVERFTKTSEFEEVYLNDYCQSDTVTPPHELCQVVDSPQENP